MGCLFGGDGALANYATISHCAKALSSVHRPGEGETKSNVSAGMKRSGMKAEALLNEGKRRAVCDVCLFDPANDADGDGAWTSRPGNSSNQPPTIPLYMAVIVSSSVQTNDPVISGHITKIIVMRTNSVYGPSAGHSSPDQVVAILCDSADQSATLESFVELIAAIRIPIATRWLSESRVGTWISASLGNNAFPPSR